MDITEIKRRIAILEKQKEITVNKRMLRGGMDYRNKRRMVDGYNRNLSNTKKKYADELAIKEKLFPDGSILMTAFSEPTSPLDEDFILPKLRKTRIGGKGWF